MRRSLVWLLLVTLALSAWALWSQPEEPPRDEQRPLASQEVAMPGGKDTSVRRPPTSSVDSERAVPELALRDPFAPGKAESTSQQRSAVLAAAPQASVPMAAPAPPLPPAAPPHRFVGRFTSPSGETMVFISDGDAQIRAVEGASLATGFVVASVAIDRVELRNAATGQSASVEIPQPRPQ